MKTNNTPAESGKVTLLDRDLSILAFNERVLEWAHRADVPALERLRYLCIVSSNLDEFFEIRAAPHLPASRTTPGEGTEPTGGFFRIADAAHRLVDRQYTIFNDEVLPALGQHGIRIVPHGERNQAQRQWIREYFNRAVRPLLVPVSLDPSHPFPLVANKSLNFVVRLNGVDAFGRDNEIAIVKVPRALQRMIQLPSKVSGSDQLWVSLSSVIRAHLHELFTSRQVTQFSQFRVTRHSDLAIDEEEVKNLRTALRLGLQKRHFREAVRLEVSSGCSAHLSDFLLAEFKLPREALYRVHGPVNMVRLSEIITHARSPELLFPAYQPAWPEAFQGAEQSVFERIREGDALVHQPFESFDAVLAFLREAVEDPAVLAIKQTIYRTGARSALMDLLEEAVRRGKDVTVVVELKARFDEEVNINWAERLESIGAQVVYGVVGLKTHAKMLLVTRREGKRLRRYVHLSTGNYNPVTARLYTDLSYFSCDAALTMDVDNVFLHLASQIRLPRLRRLLVAPLTLHKWLQEEVDAIGAAARNGVAGRIIIKTNALTDEPLIRALIRAGQNGVRIDLIVRGACMLPPGLPGQTDNIRVRSIVGRFLEHSRVFYFRSGDKEQVYLSSADWMNRNMLRRIELAWPVIDPHLRRRVVDECLVPYLLDERDAWTMDHTGRYQCVSTPPHGNVRGAQESLMRLHNPAATADRNRPLRPRHKTGKARP
jgi:polyphosphate kinase